MKTNNRNQKKFLGGLAAAVCLAATSPGGWAAHMAMGHLIPGATGPNFTLTAKSGYVTTGEGNSVYFWGYGLGTGPAQYSGPTLIVQQGDTVNVTLNNELPVPVSIVFPGQKVTAVGGAAGLLTQEAAPGTPVTYTFTASEPGTYLYHSGTQPTLQIEMGLVGALIVRPEGFDPMQPMTWKAYGDGDSVPAEARSRFDQEYLFLLTEMDEKIHDQVEAQVKNYQPISVDLTKWFPVYWFLNGRSGADTMLPAGADAPYLPVQPYNCMPMFHPGQQVLMRVIGAGRDPHPFHHHGNHSRIIAKDGRLLSSGPGAGADLSHQVFTITTTPGGTVDALYSWTGKGLGWDVYGHTNVMDALLPFEDPDSHGKPFPTILPPDQDLTFGFMYGGSPFLGTANPLPPGQGGFNSNGGFSFMWHSHSEKEICDNNIFPGGIMTMTMIEAYPPPPMPMP